MNKNKHLQGDVINRVIKQYGGSHVTFQHPDGKTLTVEKPHGREAYCHPKRVRKVLRLLNENT